MAYTKQQWHDDTTDPPYGPINGDRLNHIEDGIDTAQTTAESALAASGIGTALPLVDGTASAGVGAFASAEDHVHPTDTSRAPLASPSFTGTPAAPTAAAATNTTQVATTAFVTTADNLKANLASPTFSGTPSLPTGTTGVTQSPGNNSTKLATTAYADAIAAGGGGVSLGSSTPIVDGTAATGTASTASHEDHVHPTDTSRAPLASPTFSGTPALPTGTTGITQSAGDSSTKLATTAFVTTADNLKANLASPTFSGTPSLPTGTTAVTQTAGNNSTKLATTAYADAAGSGGLTINQSWSFFAKTNGTTVTLYDAAGGTVSSGTDLGALFNAQVATGQLWIFGPGDFPVTTTITVPDETYTSITLQGAGGNTNENIQNINIINAATRFVYSPISGTVIRVNKAQGVKIKGIHIQTTHNSYTGSVVDFQGDYTTSPRKVSRHCGIQDCFIHTRKGDTIGACLEVSTVVDFTAINCQFRGGRWSVRGVRTAVGVNTYGEPSDEVHFYACRFQNAQSTYACVSNPYKNWSFLGCTFETTADGSHCVILRQDSDIPALGSVSFIQCGAFDYADPTADSAALFNYSGEAIQFVGGFYAQPPSGFLNLNGTTTGIFISGLHFVSTPGSQPLVTVGSGTVSDVVIEGNGALPATLLSGAVTQPPLINRTPYKGLVADTTLTHQDHNMRFGVTALAAARTITLPAVTCVGFTVSVKKTDSSGNTVTIARAGSATIDGATSVVLSAQYNSVSLVSDGTNWQITGQVP